MLEAIAKMASRPVAEVRRIHMLEADLGRVVRMLRSPDSQKSVAAESSADESAHSVEA